MQWNIVSNGQQKGPYSTQDVVAIAQGSSADMMVCEVGKSDWMPAASHPVFARAIASMSAPRAAPAGALICSNCYVVGEPDTAGPGIITAITALSLTLVGVIVSWIALIFAVLLGIYYTVARKTVCAACKSPDLVPPDSPRGREILARPRA